MTRDRILKQMRPELPVVVEVAVISDAEKFQNTTLRQVVKLQNDLLLAAFQHYIVKRKELFYELSDRKKLDYIDHAITRDVKFKNFLVGMIIGHFTQSEWQYFKENESECSRRIKHLIIHRIQDQSADL